MRDRKSVRQSRVRYGWHRLAGDVSGGTIAALIALPYGLAMAHLMGLPPTNGLFTSILTSPITALLGRNPVLIGGTASATVPFIAGAVRLDGVAGAAKVCIAAAVFLMIFSVLRLGRYVAKVPHSVVSGFSCGVGAMMVVLQLRSLLGLPAPASGGSEQPLAQLLQVIGQIGSSRVQPLMLGAIVIGTAALLARRWPRSPAALVGVTLSLVVALVLGWRERTVGTVSLELPPVVSFTWRPADLIDILPAALGLAIVTAVNILITSRVVEHFQGRHRGLRPADADAELGAYGIANLCAGAFGAPISVGIPARSVANVRCGGSTRLSNFLHGLVLLGLIEFGAGLIAVVPLAALAGVTAYVGFSLLEWSTWRRLPRMRRVDAAAFLCTAVTVLAANAIAAVVVGCALHAAGDLVARSSLAAALPVPGPVTVPAAEPREADS
jgi:SulP family sulfate permease